MYDDVDKAQKLPLFKFLTQAPTSFFSLWKDLNGSDVFAGIHRDHTLLEEKTLGFTNILVFFPFYAQLLNHFMLNINNAIST